MLSASRGVAGLSLAKSHYDGCNMAARGLEATRRRWAAGQAR